MFEHLMIWIHFLEYFGPSSHCEGSVCILKLLPYHRACYLVTLNGAVYSSVLCGALELFSLTCCSETSASLQETRRSFTSNIVR